MPNKVVIEKWCCGSCGKVHDTEELALGCEQKDIERQYVNAFRNLFPRCHQEDSKYTKHCPGCGMLLREYEVEWDGHRNDVGRCIFEAKVETESVLGVVRCKACSNEVIRELVDAVLSARGDQPVGVKGT